MSASKDPNPTPAMTPAQHLRQAEHLLSELSFESDGMPAVRWRDRFYDALSMEYPRIVAHLQSRAWLHARIAEVQASLPQEVSIMPAQDWEQSPAVSAAASVSVDAEQALWLLECVKTSFDEGWAIRRAHAVVARLAAIAGVEPSEVIAE